MRPAHLIGLVSLGAIWGASFMFIKVALEELSPLAVRGRASGVAAS